MKQLYAKVQFHITSLLVHRSLANFPQCFMFSSFEEFPIRTWPARDPRHKPSSSERTFFPCVGTYVVGECDDEQATASKRTNKMYVQKI